MEIQVFKKIKWSSDHKYEIQWGLKTFIGKVEGVGNKNLILIGSKYKALSYRSIKSYRKIPNRQKKAPVLKMVREKWSKK